MFVLIGWFMFHVVVDVFMGPWLLLIETKGITVGPPSSDLLSSCSPGFPQRGLYLRAPGVTGAHAHLPNSFRKFGPRLWGFKLFRNFANVAQRSTM